jgi:hypothetical protein
MNTEVLLARGETVTSFEIPAAGKIKVAWPEPKVMKILVPVGSKLGPLKSDFQENFKEILNPELISHLDAAWPANPDLQIDRKPVALDPWDQIQIEIIPQKKPRAERLESEIALDRPRITIQMGQRVDEFSENCKQHLKPELFEHVVRLWSDPDYCRAVMPIGRNLLIRGCA